MSDLPVCGVDTHLLAHTGESVIDRDDISVPVGKIPFPVIVLEKGRVMALVESLEVCKFPRSHDIVTFGYGKGADSRRTMYHDPVLSCPMYLRGPETGTVTLGAVYF